MSWHSYTMQLCRVALARSCLSLLHKCVCFGTRTMAVMQLRLLLVVRCSIMNIRDSGGAPVVKDSPSQSQAKSPDWPPVSWPAFTLLKYCRFEQSAKPFPASVSPLCSWPWSLTPCGWMWWNVKKAVSHSLHCLVLCLKWSQLANVGAGV